MKIEHLPLFRDRVREYYKELNAPDGNGPMRQVHLAAAMGVGEAALSDGWSNSPRRSLTEIQVRQIVRILAEWQAIETRQQAIALLDLVECPHFTQEDWGAFPLNELTETPAPSTTLNEPTDTPASPPPPESSPETEPASPPSPYTPVIPATPLPVLPNFRLCPHRRPRASTAAMGHLKLHGRRIAATLRWGMGLGLSLS